MERSTKEGDELILFKNKQVKKEWMQHENNWRACNRCHLHKSATHHCLGRGHLPADILFIGEGPGRTENQTGNVFSGPSGKILDELIKLCVTDIGQSTYFITNLVACRPCDGVLHGNRAPTELEVIECRPRVQSVFALANPKLVVLVGRVPESYLSQEVDILGKGKVRSVYMAHPSYILRSGGVNSKPFADAATCLREACVEVGLQ